MKDDLDSTRLPEQAREEAKLDDRRRLRCCTRRRIRQLSVVAELIEYVIESSRLEEGEGNERVDGREGAGNEMRRERSESRMETVEEGFDR